MLKKLVLGLSLTLFGCGQQTFPPPKPITVAPEKPKPLYMPSFSPYGFTIRKTDSGHPVFIYQSNSVLGYSSSLFPDACELDLGDVKIVDQLCDLKADKAIINGKLYADEDFLDVKEKVDTIYLDYWNVMGVDSAKKEYEKARSADTLEKYLK